MAHLLLVEDDPVLGRGLMINLQLENYKVDWVQNLKAAVEIWPTKKFDLVILDIGLPDGKGLSLLRQIREEKNRTPVVVLTAQTDENSVVEGLQAGANDYVRKPFGNRELLARLKVALREPSVATAQIRFDALLLDLDQRKVFWNERHIDLNRREFDVLQYFVMHADSVITRESLLQALDKDGEIFDRTIDSHVSHIRTRLKQAGVSDLQISSVYGIGYRLERRGDV